MKHNDDERQEIRNELGKRLKNARKSNGLTQLKVSEMTQIPKSTISKYERGITEIPSSVIPKLSLVCGITIEDLFKGMGIPNKVVLENIIDKIGFIGMSNYAISGFDLNKPDDRIYYSNDPHIKEKILLVGAFLDGEFDEDEFCRRICEL